MEECMCLYEMKKGDVWKRRNVCEKIKRERELIHLQMQGVLCQLWVESTGSQRDQLCDMVWVVRRSIFGRLS